jgi:4'-phosphopantetheinyl transferase
LISFREWTPVTRVPPPPDWTAAAAAPPPLADGEVHLWFGTLDPSPEVARELTAMLSPDEEERARGFRYETLRRRFRVGRGVLRLLLGAYTGRPPSRLAFAYGPRGKPFLDDPPPPGAPPLHFNLGHSDAGWLLGVTRVGRLGVDLERLRPRRDVDELVEAHFSPREIAAFRSVDADARTRAFLAGWTRKEAFLKATGDGLAVELDSFDVTLEPGAPPAVRRAEGEHGPAGRWTLLHVEPSAGYVGAACIDGTGVRASGWRWAGGAPGR